MATVAVKVTPWLKTEEAVEGLRLTTGRAARTTEDAVPDWWAPSVTETVSG